MNLPTQPLTISRILIPIDFSPTSTKALHYGVALAARLACRIRLIHVISIGDYMKVSTHSASPDEAIKSLGTREATMLQDIATAISEGTDVQVESVVLDGPAPDAILKQVEAGGIDLIVMGTHGRTGFKHALLGSIAEEVVRKSPVPVLTVRG